MSVREGKKIVSFHADAGDEKRRGVRYFWHQEKKGWALFSSPFLKGGKRGASVVVLWELRKVRKRSVLLNRP